MSKKVGKFLCVVLSALTAFTLCLTGCGSETGGNSGKPQTPGGDDPGPEKTYLSESDYPREKMSVSACGNVDGYLPSHVCTENPNAYWRADERACSHDGGHYLIVQLQSEQIVTGIKYMPPSDFTGAFTECEVLYGHDGVSFKSAGVAQWKKDASEKTIVFSEPVKAKYIKLVGDGTTCAEITVRVGVDTPESLVGYVDTLAGKVEKGATIAGPTMPNGSIHPSPETLNRENGGYTTGQNVVGFGQLYAQGTGGHQSYGNFLLSPQVGNIQTDEKNHASPVSYERGTANYYSANLDKYGIFAEVTPAKNAAMYRFSYPQSDSAVLLLDISRKIGGNVSLQSGTVQIDKSSNTITGGGTYSGNWNAAPWQMYVAVKFDKIPKEIGVWDGAGLTSDKTSGISSGNNQRLGAYVKFDTVANEEIKVKVAISFTSTDKALEYLNEQLPDWDFEAVRNRCAEKWNEILHGVELGEADNSVKSRFYSALFFANVHPRDRVDDHGTWDDYYTVWDSWKSVFPFLTLTRPDVISDNVNSFIKRFAENGMMTDAYIQGKEFLCGQGGNDIENIIADAYIKNISGVDWERAYAAVKGNSEVLRSAQYISHGYQYDEDRKAINGMSYSYRLYPSSATMGFAYNDYAVSVMAKGLGKTDDAKFFARRSENWKKLLNENFVADGFTGFAQNRNADGTFPKVSNPSSGYNSHYYEANIWEGSFYPVFDMAGMIELMGGRKEFTRRLEYACENGHIKFDNEPAFQTVWLFSHSEIRRPDLTAKYADKFLNYFPEEGGYHDDEDGGAMSTMYMFLMSGFFPISCTDRYYLHGTRLPEITYNLSDGKKFVIKGINTSPDNIYVKSATFNGKPLNDCVLTHEDIVSGGTLEFVMDSVPSDWAKFPEDTVRPDDAENLRADIDRAQSGIVELNWDAADGADKYYVYCGDSADFATSERNMIAQTESPRYVGVARPGTMWYKVRSVGSNGNVSRNACVAELTVGNDFGNAVDGYDGNIALGKSATASGKSGPAGSTVYDEPAYAVDGNGGTKWSCRSTDTAPGDGTGNYWLEIDLGNTYVVRRWKVAHAQSGGESADYNTKAFSLQAYIDGEWINVDTVDDNVYRVTERVVPAFAARRVRLYITQPVRAGGSVSARIYEFALYASAEREDIDFTESFDGTSLPVGFNLNTSGGGKADFSENGCVTVSTDTSGTVELDKTFDRSFYGVMAHEIRFKNLSSRSNEFANIVFLKNSGNNSYVVTIAVESGRLRYNADNSGWKTVQYKGKDLYLLDNAWYTLKVVNDYETQKTKLYLTGDLYGSGGKTSTAALGDDVFLGEYNFRNKNVGDPDTFEMAIGTGKSGTAFTVDYIKTYVWKEV